MKIKRGGGFKWYIADIPGKYISIEWLFNPHDLWIGCFWKRYPKAISMYLCFLPALPIELYFQWGK